mmetsp:Transcript_21993/g.32486  ORF Transcript_21993/g.32486 Transcript_21993/m.32486 type:complete len:140 (-) Transcript_21993:198-617(-)|eukprot:CAMPEP_0194219640 /NCGR_PEP_ID=MMETSP0156-20130528/26453_1 /TAXON_ID=33649 /ORGANISM="Thalassionema nitzschioides, Strain L26-B" /LENGTH=139 /DNA_ID=CAMNT_0038949391 /DNA_START=35 /DNA_END=454 /DNA_ORIENTATION=-
MFLIFALLLASVIAVKAFNPVTVEPSAPSSVFRMASSDDNETQSSLMGFFKNTVQDVGDIFSNLDDVIDDFYNKRMGNGEIFYGKRKFKPSGEVDGAYNGFGLSDKAKIEETQQMKEYYLELKKIREEKIEKERRERER